MINLTQTTKSRKLEYMRKTLWLCAGLLLLFCLTLVARVHLSADSEREPQLLMKSEIAAALSGPVRAMQWPQKLELPVLGLPQKLNVQYSLNSFSQDFVAKQFQLYKPDYAAFVAMDARTGRVLAMQSYQRERGNENLALQSRFPAASIFKIVTATAALDTGKANPDTVIAFNGRNHTLYKRNVNSDQVTRWTRYMTVREAFARSVNVVFGKIGLFMVGPDGLESYARRFLFNQAIPADFPLSRSEMHLQKEDAWNVASAASGFTRDTKMSAAHGALIAAAVANDGVMMEPYVVESLVDANGVPVYKAQPKTASVVLDAQSAEQLRELMQDTVRRGTSRKSFKTTLRKRQIEMVEFGGKTGSLTGGDPYGKCDWFVGYGRFDDMRIAVGVLTVNKDKWRVKSSYLASEYLRNYFNANLPGDQVANYRGQ